MNIRDLSWYPHQQDGLERLGYEDFLVLVSPTGPMAGSKIVTDKSIAMTPWPLT